MAQDARVEALPEVVEFLGSAPVKGLTGGLDTESAHGETLTTVAHNVFPHDVPYGGVNKSGVGGGVLGPDTLFDYWRSLSVVRPL